MISQPIQLNIWGIRYGQINSFTYANAAAGESALKNNKTIEEEEKKSAFESLSEWEEEMGREMGWVLGTI